MFPYSFNCYYIEDYVCCAFILSASVCHSLLMSCLLPSLHLPPSYFHKTIRSYSPVKFSSKNVPHLAQSLLLCRISEFFMKRYLKSLLNFSSKPIFFWVQCLARSLPRGFFINSFDKPMKQVTLSPFFTKRIWSTESLDKLCNVL